MNVNFETLQQAEDDIAAQVAAIRSTIDDLERYLESHLSQWSGPARDAYAVVKSQWDQAVANMADVLQKAGAHVGTASDTYRATENKNVGIWQP
jgi:WXG100 family type VII secretion target